MIYPRSCVLAIESSEREREKRRKKMMKNERRKFPEEPSHTRTYIGRHWRTRGIARIADCSSIWLSIEKAENQSESNKRRVARRRLLLLLLLLLSFLFAAAHPTDNLEDLDRKRNKEKRNTRKKLLWKSASTGWRRRRTRRRERDVQISLSSTMSTVHLWDISSVHLW